MKFITYNSKKIFYRYRTAPIFNTDGFIAMFSFLVMVTVVGILVAVFSVLVFRNIFLARTGAANFENVYAVEGFIEDTLERIHGSSWAGPADGAVMAVGDSTVSVAISTEGSIRSYYFSAETGDKYFKNEVLKIDTSNPSNKIVKWQDSL